MKLVGPLEISSISSNSKFLKIIFSVYGFPNYSDILFPIYFVIVLIM